MRYRALSTGRLPHVDVSHVLTHMSPMWWHHTPPSPYSAQASVVTKRSIRGGTVGKEGAHDEGGGGGIDWQACPSSGAESARLARDPRRPGLLNARATGSCPGRRRGWVVCTRQTLSDRGTRQESAGRRRRAGQRGRGLERRRRNKAPVSDSSCAKRHLAGSDRTVKSATGQS